MSSDNHILCLEDVHVYKIHNPDDIIIIRSALRKLTAQGGFNLADQTRLSTAFAELARNVLQYAGVGSCKISYQSQGNTRKITVVVEDNGEGILNINQAVRNGFSSSGALGAGLPSVQRLMDEFQIESRPGLTKVTIAMIDRKLCSGCWHDGAYHEAICSEIHKNKD